MIFKAERLDAECGIMCLAYIERMITLTGLTMDPVNWRRIVLCSHSCFQGMQIIKE